jgi:hypothetical protein
MKDYTLQENKITADFLSVVFKYFRKVRYGIQAITTKDINYDLALVRYELLQWQLLPGTNKTLFADPAIYPLGKRKVCNTGCETEIDETQPVTPVIMVINNTTPPDTIVEIIDEIPDYVNTSY